MHRFKAIILAGALALLVAGCQSTGGMLAPDAVSRLKAAGYEPITWSGAVPQSDPATTVTLDAVYRCPAARCGADTVALQLSWLMNSGIGNLTYEEAFRRKLLKDSTLQDLMQAGFSVSDSKDAKLTSLRQFVTGPEAGFSFEVTGSSKDGTRIYGAGRFIAKGNTAQSPFVMSTSRPAAQRGLALMTGR